MKVNCIGNVLFTDLLLLNHNGAKSVLVMAKKCLERAEDIYIDVIEKSPSSTAALFSDQPPPLPSRDNLSFSDEWKKSNGIEQIPAMKLVVMSW